MLKKDKLVLTIVFFYSNNSNFNAGFSNVKEKGKNELSHDLSTINTAFTVDYNRLERKKYFILIELHL